MNNQMSLLYVIVIVAGILLSGCNIDSSTSTDIGKYTQSNLIGTWEETISGRRYTFNSIGEVQNVESGRDQVLKYSGNVKVIDTEGNISGNIFLTHIHEGMQNAHSHPIEYSGTFASNTEINLSWNVPGAGNGTATWNKVQ